MASGKHEPTPGSVDGRAVGRRRAALLLVAVLLLVVVGVAVALGWVGWLVNHPEQAWTWIRERWFAASGLGVFVGLAGVIVAVVMSRWQQRRSEQVAAAERNRQEQREQEQLTRHSEQAARAAWEQRCRSLLALWPLPVVQEVNPYAIGVFYSRRAERTQPDEHGRPPYVHRPADKALAGLLASQSLVLVKGQSRAGKSRTAFEVAGRELAGWRLLVPKDRAALAALTELELLPGQGDRVLVWLDDLEQYLATDGISGLDAGLLGRWAACDPPAKVLATIRLEEYGRLIATPGELGRSVRELLNRFDAGAVTLPVDFDSPDERAAIAALYPGEQVTGGLAEYLAAAHELVDRLEVGQASVPEGAGLVLAAVDWRRAGLNRPIAKADLAALLPLYLKRLRPLLPLKEGEVDRGLGWATEPVGRTAALLVADPDPLTGTFRVADPVVDYIERREGRRLAIPAVWEYLLGRVSPPEATNVGFAAYTRGELATAERAWRQAIDSGHAKAAPIAAFNLGVLLQEQGDVAGARAAFQQAIDSGHSDAAPKAAVNLGVLLQQEGDVAGARAAFQQAIDSGHPDQVPIATRNLGLLLKEEGDVAGARAAFQQVIDSGHHDEAVTAMRSLGLLLKQEGDVAGARAAFQQVIDSGHHDDGPAANVNLGVLLKQEGDVAGARAAYQQAIDSGHSDAAPRAAFNLGLLLAEQGDMAGARAAYQQAIDSGHPDAAANAEQALRILGRRGVDA